MYEVRSFRIQYVYRERCENSSHGEIEKLALLDFIMAALASDFSFNFYNALD